MNSNKSSARYLKEILKIHRVKDVVICPGSRNAPLIIAFTSDPYFNTYTIVDERSASFFALGISQKTRNTVAIICTSGSALINIGPAVAEAYYQRLPLLVISADRPVEWVNQGESQTFDQHGVFRNFVRASFDLVQEPTDAESIHFQNRQINEAINKTRFPDFGPVHINVRFREPLYDVDSGEMDDPIILKQSKVKAELDPTELEELQASWNKYERIVILCGMSNPDPELNAILNQLSSLGITVLTESTSNLHSESFFPCIDRVIMPASHEEKQALKPELVISICGPVISRRIKSFFREYGLTENWRVDLLEYFQDAFMHQTKAIAMNASQFLVHFTTLPKKDLAFQRCWSDLDTRSDARQTEFLEKADYSDLTSFAFLHRNIPEHSHIHVANSSPIRYVQLFRPDFQRNYFANRGTSGIEGSLSTAVGYSLHHHDKTFVIAGDLSTLYDSNALWNNYLHPNLKIIVLNNGGGGIFRIIPGPKTVKGFEKLIEARHEMNFNKLAELFNLTYFYASDQNSLESRWSDFLNEDQKAALLEIDTRSCENELVLMDYFNYLQNPKQQDGQS
ncbi:MAG: 2-succinyl-5-enolpyruvyl-6-hydroxy-3-cyclohexene-1-carboxylic-acid synthase [Vicingaceae bacterium]